MARSAVTSDYYSILGVTPAAEDVVIRAAYRALMRHYHPDTNPDPEAQRKAQEITAAFAVLRDATKRAEYDSLRTGGTDLTIIDDPFPQRRPPAMRGVGIATAALATALVAAVWVLPQPNPSRGPANVAPRARQAPHAKATPPVELEPESARLARLRGEPPVAPPHVVPSVELPAPSEASLAPTISLPAHVEPMRVATASTRTVARARTAAPPPPALALRQTKPAALPPEPSAGCRPGGAVAVSVGCKNDRLATLDRMAAGFFSQSMAHADAAKKELLMSAHTRSAATRAACHSDSCVSDAYLRQMREISSIMQSRESPAN